MLIRVEKKWFDKPFKQEATTLILVQEEVTKAKALALAADKLVPSSKKGSIRSNLNNYMSFFYEDKEGFVVLANVYIDHAIEKHLEEMLRLSNFSRYSRKAQLIYEGYICALYNEGYDYKRLEGMLDAYAKLKNAL